MSEPRRRQGGREARRQKRLAPDRGAPPPAAPGQVGGQYKPLSEAQLRDIHRAALRILERIGMAGAPPLLAERACAAGARLDAEGRLCFPPGMVEDVVAGAGRNFVLHGREARHDIELGGARVHYGTGGAAVRTLDRESGAYRPSTLHDLYDFARLVDALENVSWFTRCVVATDLADPFALDLNTAYACLAGTSKHIGTSFALAEHVAPVIAMFDSALGAEGAFRKRPFCKVHISPVVSPLRYGEDAVGVALAAIEQGMPINSIIAAQSGATAPATLAGMLAQTTAETLAGLILVNLFAPGHPTIFSNWPFVIDLRSGAFSGSGGEISALNAAAAQLSQFYDLPGGVSAAMADSKIPDMQAGYEKAISTLATGLAGANLIYESAGMFASLLGCSFEGFVVDNEILGAALRTIRGIEVSEETLALEVIEEVARGPGHYLGHDHTVGAMQRDYYYPELSDRDSPDAWAERGALDMRQRAKAKAEAILGEHFPETLSAEADARIRARFDIRLPRAAMGPRP